MKKTRPPYADKKGYFWYMHPEGGTALFHNMKIVGVLGKMKYAKYKISSAERIYKNRNKNPRHFLGYKGGFQELNDGILSAIAALKKVIEEIKPKQRKKL